MKRSACVRRSVSALASKRSSRLRGNRLIVTGGMKRSHTDCHNRVDAKLSRHHCRQRFSVTAAMRSRSRSARAEALLRGETSINTTPRYTRRPAKRTDAEVVRNSHRPQVKLSRREYSAWTATGQRAACVDSSPHAVIPRMPVRQWVVSFPIALRVLFAAHPELLTPLLRIVHRVITGFLLGQAGLRRGAADAGAVTLIQRFGSAANLNIHLHCLVLDGLYRRTEGKPVFHEARAPTRDELQGLLGRIIARLLKVLTRSGYLVEEKGMTYRPTSIPITRSRPCKRPRARIASRWGRAPGR
jgi:Putative transposase